MGAVPGTDLSSLQQAALRRVAGLIGSGAAPAEVFAAVAHEVAQVTGSALVQIQRFETDDTVTVMGAWGVAPHPFQPGTNWGLEGSQIAEPIKRTGKPVRVDDFGVGSGPIREGVRKTGIRGGAGAPIFVGGALWGSMAAGPAEGEPVPEDLEQRLAEFTDLIATAISNAESREALTRLAAEQAALRRVATLVAECVPPDALFAAIAREAGELLGVDVMHMSRYEDGAAVSVAGWSRDDRPLPAGTRVDLDGVNAASRVSVPIVVNGALWGLMIASSKEIALPRDTESRLLGFTELAETAISNTAARAEIEASRARLLAAADEERMRVVRDLHDGAGRRLDDMITTIARAAEQLGADDASARELVEQALSHAERTTAELRELARGILPVSLTSGGLHAAAEALASRMPVPVEVDVARERHPPAVEATAYFVIAEALTNVAKHSGARHASVRVRGEAGALCVEVRDDGVGGARPDAGSGLTGLADRVGACEGSLTVVSPLGEGTLVRAELPLSVDDHA
jgi:signal transduction histidine kinase